MWWYNKYLKQIPFKLCKKKVSFYVSECVTSEYFNPHWKASDRLGEHKIIAVDKQVTTYKRFTVDHTVMQLILYFFSLNCWIQIHCN